MLLRGGSGTSRLSRSLPAWALTGWRDKDTRVGMQSRAHLCSSSSGADTGGQAGVTVGPSCPAEPLFLVTKQEEETPLLHWIAPGWAQGGTQSVRVYKGSRCAVEPLRDTEPWGAMRTIAQRDRGGYVQGGATRHAWLRRKETRPWPRSRAWTATCRELDPNFPRAWGIGSQVLAQTQLLLGTFEIHSPLPPRD